MNQPLRLYLRSHEAGAQAGRDLFRRASHSHRRQPYAGELQQLTSEVAADLESLRTLIRAVGTQPDRVLGTALRLGERVGRLKPNGRVLRRAPLTDLVEVEGLLDAVHAKAAGWRALLAVPSPDWGGVVDLDLLLARADSQLELLRTIHGGVAARVLSAEV